MVIFDTKEWEILEFLISVKLLNQKVNSDKLSDYILKSMKSSFDKSCVFGEKKGIFKNWFTSMKDIKTTNQEFIRKIKESPIGAPS